jgi:monoterpene epsilon-lactone hydrolase
MTSAEASAREHVEARLQSLPKPSRQAEIASRLLRMVVKRWPRGKPTAIVRRSRKVLGLGSIFSGLHTRGTLINSVLENGVRGEWIVPNGCSSPDKVVLYLHGGGYVSCSPRTHRAITCSLARMASLSCLCSGLSHGSGASVPGCSG